MKSQIKILSLLVFFLFSCSSDEGITAESTDKIIGTWGIYEYLEEDGRTQDVNPDLSYNQITFHEDGSFTSERIDEPGNYIWVRLSDNEIGVKMEDSNIEGYDKFEFISDNKIVTKYGNGEASYFIKID